MKKFVFIGLGGFLGAAARFAVKSAPIWITAGFPFNTLLINISGSFLLAFLLTAVLKTMDMDLKMGISTGLLGGFTTFSTLCREAFSLIKAGDWLAALSYTAISAVLGLTAAYFGAWMALKANFRLDAGDAAVYNAADGEAE